jgi:hypothetical protein
MRQVGGFLRVLQFSPSDGKGNNLNKDKDNAISIEDIKISNIMREAEINDPPSSREVTTTI